MARNKNWFRFYDRMIDSPQVLALNDSEFRLIVSLWCIASAEGREGAISYSDAIIRRRLMPDKPMDEVVKMLDHLKELDLLAGVSGSYTIPRWEVHQYEYPSRSPKNRKPNAKQWGSDGEVNGKIDTDTDTDTEKEAIVTLPDATTKERLVLNALEGIYPSLFQYVRDLAFIRELAVKFPNIDLVEEVSKWKLWLDEKRKKPKNWRLAFRNWCAKAEEFQPKKGGRRPCVDPKLKQLMEHEGPVPLPKTLP